MKLKMVVTGFMLIVGGLASGVLVPDCAWAQSEEERESRWGKDEAKAKSVILTRRMNNNAYGTSAYSFKDATHDLRVHRNNVDLVFNGCGLLHFNPVGGMRSRVADLGEAELDVEFDEDQDRIWARDAFYPEEGHVYWQEIKTRFQTMTVKFRVEELERDEMRITWMVVRELEGDAPPGGMSGTMGQCGGHHSAR